MVASLDGFIAKPDNSIAWFETSCDYQKGVDFPTGIDALEEIDCYVMGSHTYELAWALSKDYGWAYGDKPTLVLSNRLTESELPQVEFYAGEIPTLVVTILKPRYRNIWVVGGADLAKKFLQHRLVDEIRINILPILLGEGLPFFDSIGIEQALILEDSKAYKNGMLELSYLIPRR